MKPRYLAQLSQEQRQAKIVEFYGSLPTGRLQKRLRETETLLDGLKGRFPGWDAWSHGYGPGNNPPAYYTEIRKLEDDRQYTILELSRRGKLGTQGESTKPTREVQAGGVERPAGGTMGTTHETNPFSLPGGFASAGDPIDGNPFPTGDPRHKVWQQATLMAEEELCRLNSKFLRGKPTGQEGFAKWMEQNKWVSAREDFTAWVLSLCVAKFDIWAKRGIQVVWSADSLRAYDQWLFNYAQAWLEAQRKSGHLTDGALFDLRSRLAEHVEWWKGEARRYLAAQKAHLAGASHANTPPDANTASSNPTDRRAMVDAYIEEVRRKKSKRITRKAIWSAAGYQTRTEFERWERRDAKHPNQAADDNFTRILREKPHLK
jgi:hypothetical protein